MTRPLVILGTGGNAYDVLDIVEALNACSPSWEVHGFLDDARPPGSDYLGFPLLGGLGDAGRFGDCAFISAIHSERTFRAARDILGRTGLGPDRFATLVHPTASVSSRAALGRGAYVNAGAVVAGGVVLGDHVLLGPGCIVGHNAEVGSHSIVAPGAVLSGFVRVDDSSYVGARAVVRQRLCIGAGALVGMGAVVTRDVPPGETVVGNPARPLRRPSDPSSSVPPRSHAGPD
jgi:sugar O-acyltransferase (sialic acid O-acetyltransferase NeuD family)